MAIGKKFRRRVTGTPQRDDRPHRVIAYDAIYGAYCRSRPSAAGGEDDLAPGAPLSPARDRRRGPGRSGYVAAIGSSSLPAISSASSARTAVVSAAALPSYLTPNSATAGPVGNGVDPVRLDAEAEGDLHGQSATPRP